MACLSSIVVEFLSSVFLAIPIVLIMIVLRNDSPIETYRSVVLILFIIGITFDAMVWLGE